MTDQDSAALDGFVSKLRRELWDWRGFGVLPGTEKLRFYVERVDLARADTGDLVFVFLAVALALAEEWGDDDVLTDMEISLDVLADLLFQRAADGDSQIVAGLHDGRLRLSTSGSRKTVWTSAGLADGETRVLVGHLVTLPGDARAMFGQLMVRDGDGVEAIAYQDGSYEVVRYREARRAASAIVRLLTNGDEPS